ncbi:protein FAR1-RELATED SEQUENCE 5-like [Olea europaea var. sylvestris]|uniref:protein FAR1-RELATED SEQUENCE 5-like n=1 Tax=Olea europaea var. sylvestris TaxID=158386 RepID=UPI000C1D479F|nr:protein FAR1-RELATED SEQUENCE 5-like [Olea europaea var. sylvestris]
MYLHTHKSNEGYAFVGGPQLVVRIRLSESFVSVAGSEAYVYENSSTDNHNQDPLSNVRDNLTSCRLALAFAHFVCFLNFVYRRLPFFLSAFQQEQKPKVGQEFEKIEGAYEFHNTYTRDAGFSARLFNSKKRLGTSEVFWKQFVCYKEGEKDNTYQKKFKHMVERSGERHRGVIRVGCKAKLTVVRPKSSINWIVSSFVESHNHALTTPTRVHLLRSHRHDSNAKKALIQHFSEATISTSQQISLMEIGFGGPQNIGCTKKDIRNYERDLREEMKGIDVESYGMIFAPLTGVNHHFQTIIFGCGFLSDETIESFAWSFKCWLTAMPKGAPQLIITDQDPALTRAIVEVLPNTFHRYCIWHIQNKFSEKLNAIIYRDNYDLMKNIILNFETTEELETNWSNMLHSTKLIGNDWLHQIYELRARWVPTFVKHIFATGMSSNQRAESSHSFLKRYISKKNSLMDFIIRFNRALRHQRHQELMANHCDINEKSKLKSLWPMEAQMLKVYTRKVFRTFQDEIFESQAYILNTLCEDESSVTYIIERVDKYSTSRSRKLILSKFLDIVHCSCQQFECEGIPCRHILAYFRVKKKRLQLPTQYILQRWAKSAKISQVWDKDNEELNDIPNQSLMIRHSKLSQLSSIVVDDASLTEEGANLLVNRLEELHRKIKEINIGNGIEKVYIEQMSIEERININEPQQVRAKGCGKRLKNKKDNNPLGPNDEVPYDFILKNSLLRNYKFCFGVLLEALRLLDKQVLINNPSESYTVF